MDDSINTRPLLQCDADSDFDDNESSEDASTHALDEPLVATKDTRPLFKPCDPQDRYVDLWHLIPIVCEGVS